MYLLIIHLQAVFICKQAKSSQEENKKDTDERTAALTCGLKEELSSKFPWEK